MRAVAAKRAKYKPSREKARTMLIEVEPDGSDDWKLAPVVELLRNGAVCVCLRAVYKM
jgi:hypothetical protein